MIESNILLCHLHQQKYVEEQRDPIARLLEDAKEIPMLRHGKKPGEIQNGISLVRILPTLSVICAGPGSEPQVLVGHS